MTHGPPLSISCRSLFTMGRYAIHITSFHCGRNLSVFVPFRPWVCCRMCLTVTVITGCVCCSSSNCRVPIELLDVFASYTLLLNISFKLLSRFGACCKYVSVVSCFLFSARTEDRHLCRLYLFHIRALVVYLFILFQLVHQSRLLLKHCNVTLLKIDNEDKIRW